MRKTFDLDKFVTMMNSRIRHADTVEARKALASVVSSVLMEAGAYNGFNYVNWLYGHNDENGKYIRSGHDRWDDDGRPRDNTSYLGDQSLVEFYSAKAIRPIAKNARNYPKHWTASEETEIGND